MKITVITGSPRKNGGSTLLAEEFIKGAKESGHEVYRFDSSFKNVHFCIGCNKCGMGDKPCIFKDDFVAALTFAVKHRATTITDAIFKIVFILYSSFYTIIIQ